MSRKQIVFTIFLVGILSIILLFHKEQYFANVHATSGILNTNADWSKQKSGFPGTFTQTWATEQMDEERSFGIGPRSIAIDDQNDPHIVYGGDHLYHATKTATGWTSNVIDYHWDRGSRSAIAIDDNNGIHIVYYDSREKELRYSRGSSPGSIIASGTSGEYRFPSVAVRTINDETTLVHIVFVDTENNSLKYIGPADTGQIDINLSTNGSPSVDSDAYGNPHVSYSIENNGQSELRYAYRDASKPGSEWNKQTVTLDAASYSSLAISHPYPFLPYIPTVWISYLDTDSQTLKVAWGSLPTSWQVEVVDTNLNSFLHPPSLIVGPSDVDTAKILAYTNADNEVIFASRSSGGSWNKTQVFSDEPVFAVSLTMGVNVLYMAFVGVSSDDLYVAKRENFNWEVTNIDNGAYLGNFVSFILDQDDTKQGHISYVGDGLKYTFFDDQIQTTEFIDKDIYVLGNTGVAISNSNVPYIAYRDLTNQEIRVAKRVFNSQKWQMHTLDDLVYPFRGGAVDLAIDQQFPQSLHAAYILGTDLKYALSNDDGETWQKTIIDTGGANWWDSLYSPSLEIDNYNNPHISYHGANYNGQLNYAYWYSNTWYIDTITTTYIAEAPTALALDSQNNPHIVYVAPPDNEVRYVYGTVYTSTGIITDNIEWRTSVIDYGTPYGTHYISIILDENDQPHVSYSDWHNHQLYYSYLDNGQWVKELVDQYYGTYNSIAVDENNLPYIAYEGGTDLKFAWREYQAQIPISGGKVNIFNTGSLDFPSEAFTDTANITYTPLEPVGDRPHIGFFFNLSATKIGKEMPLQFSSEKTLSMTLQYDKGQIPDGLIEEALTLYYWNGGQWELEPTSAVNTETSQIIATPNHLGTWAILFDVESIYLPAILKE